MIAVRTTTPAGDPCTILLLNDIDAIEIRDAIHDLEVKVQVLQALEDNIHEALTGS